MGGGRGRPPDSRPFDFAQGRLAGATKFCRISHQNEQLRRSYNGRVLFTLRDFRREDFETLWRIDQSCFPLGISYSRLELSAYIRRRGAFTLVAESAESGQAERGEIAKPAPSILGFIVAEASRRGMGHIITIVFV